MRARLKAMVRRAIDKDLHNEINKLGEEITRVKGYCTLKELEKLPSKGEKLISRSTLLRHLKYLDVKHEGRKYIWIEAEKDYQEIVKKGVLVEDYRKTIEAYQKALEKLPEEVPEQFMKIFKRESPKLLVECFTFPNSLITGLPSESRFIARAILPMVTDQRHTLCILSHHRKDYGFD